MNEINYSEKHKHFSYPSIGQFKNVIRNVQHTARYIGMDENGDPMYDNLAPLPTLKAVGTTKLHGTNAAAVIDQENDVVYFQSRENIITPTKDNAGFAAKMATIQHILVNLIPAPEAKQIIIYGEWCGGSIQKGVAINGLPKMFVIFDVKIILRDEVLYLAKNILTQPDGYWVQAELVAKLKSHENGVFNIYDFPTWEVDINFNKPELSQQRLSEITLEIEAQCPVGKHFGNDGVGEGAVWKIVGETKYRDSGYWMKVKGEKHSVSKVKTLAAVDVEKIENLRQFTETYVTDNRCHQSIQKLKEAGVKEITRAHLGEFIRWINGDIIKEELDTIIENGFEPKQLGGPIATSAKNWFFIHENEL